jgi:beta-glucanase (GH16 family)
MGMVRLSQLRQNLLASLAGLAVIALAGCQTPVGERLVWSDEFNGPSNSAPNAKYWGYETGGGGWGNQELECYTDAQGNVALDGAGNLVITARKQPGHICSDGKTNDYTSARILSHHKFAALYGHIEMRAKLPNTSGTWPAFWALGENIDKVGWPRAGEIDIVEAVGSKPSSILGTIHGPKTDGTPFQLSVSKKTGLRLNEKFHVYGVDWTPSCLTFTIDGKAYGSVTRTQVSQAGGKWVWDKSFYLLLDLAVGGNFPGSPEPDAPWPQAYTIDWIRVYS